MQLTENNHQRPMLIATFPQLILEVFRATGRGDRTRFRTQFTLRAATCRCSYECAWRRRIVASPAIPEAKSSRVPGSGTLLEPFVTVTLVGRKADAPAMVGPVASA